MDKRSNCVIKSVFRGRPFKSSFYICLVSHLNRQIFYLAHELRISPQKPEANVSQVTRQYITFSFYLEWKENKIKSAEMPSLENGFKKNKTKTQQWFSKRAMNCGSLRPLCWWWDISATWAAKRRDSYFQAIKQKMLNLKILYADV